MAEYSKILRGAFTSDGNRKFISLPMVPDSFEWWNLTKYGTTTNKQVVSGIAFQEDSGKALLTQSNGTANLGALSSANIVQFISAGTPQYGAITTSTAGTPVSKANPASVHSVAHGLSNGDVVLITGTTAMLQIAGVPYVVTVTGADDFTIPVDSTGFANTATSVTWKKVLYPDLYIPETCVITNITKAAQAVITTSINHNFVVGQEVFFTVPKEWGMVEMSSRAFVQNNGVPLQAYVVAVTANTLTVNVNSTGFTTFAYPTSALYATGVTPAQVSAQGDANTGYSLNSSGNVPYLGVNNGVIGIPGSFVANTRQGILLAAADGSTSTILNASDVIKWRAIFPDAVLLNS